MSSHVCHSRLEAMNANPEEEGIQLVVPAGEQLVPLQIANEAWATDLQY